jgi:hypothetical protein
MIQNYAVSINSVIRKNEGNIVSDMNGEMVMLSVTNGKYYNLGEIGGQIWELINSTRTIRDIVNELVVHYEVEQSMCESHVLHFIEGLHNEKLISLCS